MSFAARALPMRLAVYVVGAYALDLLGSLSLATPLLGWFIAHWSWRWIFWHNAVLVPGMMICVYVAIPPKPKPTGPIPAAPRVSWQGFFYASLGLSLLLGALEQGERLDWLRSGLFVSMVSAGAMLLLAAVVRRIIAPNRMVDLGFLATRNTLILGTSLFSLRFVLLGVISLIPAYLGLLQRYRPEQTGVVLLWLLVPQTLMGFVAVRLMRRLDTRLIPAAGFGTVAIACLMDARLTSDWANVNFWWPQIVMAAGLAFTFAGVVGMIIEQAVASGAVSRPVELLTYAAFFQVIRLFGGNVGAATLTRFLFVRERFHSSVLNGGLEAGYALTDERLRALATGLYPGSSGSDESQARAIASLAGQVTRQAYTLTYADGFMFLAWICAASLVALACTTATRLYLDAAPAVRTSGS
jgi:DHA2 family multidrug resistance protein